MQPYQFQVCQPPYGLREHVPPHVWNIVDAGKSTATQDDGVDGVDVCAGQNSERFTHYHSGMVTNMVLHVFILQGMVCQESAGDGVP